MKIKLLAILSLSAFLFLSGCRGDSNVNVNNANVNANRNVNVAMATPAAPAMDSATKTVVEEAMKKKNFNDVTVEATTANITLRGSVPKGKIAEAVQAAQEAGKKPVVNQLTEK